MSPESNVTFIGAAYLEYFVPYSESGSESGSQVANGTFSVASSSTISNPEVELGMGVLIYEANRRGVSATQVWKRGGKSTKCLRPRIWT